MFTSSGIYAQKNEEQECESPQGRTSVAEKRQGYSDYRTQADYHPYVYDKVQYEITCNTIGIYPTIYQILFLC